ncbi:MAG: helix-turn-helix transcriptional regulator [Pseudomonadota bacterium]
MTAKNTLLSAPPYAVEQALKRLGANLRTARLRRNLTIGDVAEKIGTGPRPVSNAEKGKSGVSAAVYIALLWVYDLLGQMDDVASPELDEHGLSLSMSRERLRAREKKELDNEF